MNPCRMYYPIPGGGWFMYRVTVLFVSEYSPPFIMEGIEFS